MRQDASALVRGLNGETPDEPMLECCVSGENPVKVGGTTDRVSRGLRPIPKLLSSVLADKDCSERSRRPIG